MRFWFMLRELGESAFRSENTIQLGFGREKTNSPRDEISVRVVDALGVDAPWMEALSFCRRAARTKVSEGTKTSPSCSVPRVLLSSLSPSQPLFPELPATLFGRIIYTRMSLLFVCPIDSAACVCVRACVPSLPFLLGRICNSLFILSVCLLSVCLSVCLCLSVFVFVCQYVCLCVGVLAFACPRSWTKLPYGDSLGASTFLYRTQRQESHCSPVS